MECRWRSPQLEVDRTRKNSDRHKKVIEANDPKAEFEREIIDGITPLDPIIILK